MESYDGSEKRVCAKKEKDISIIKREEKKDISLLKNN